MRKVVVGALVAVLLLAACSGGGGGGSSKAQSPGESSGGGSDFASLVARANAAKYKVTYQSGSDTPFTIAQDPPLFSYISGTTQTYVTADGAAIECSGGPETSPPTSAVPPTCTSLPGGGASVKQGLTSAFGAIGALFVSEAGKGIPGLGGISNTTSKRIAGRDATCAKIDSTTLGALGGALGGASYLVCIDKATGVMLESRADDGNGSVSDVKATAFGTPNEADVNPPSTPNTIPGGDVPST